MDTSTILLIASPILALDLLMKILALISVIRAERVRGPKGVWIAVIICVNLLGWAAYFIAGRDPQRA
jgi:hypothetical protein